LIDGTVHNIDPEITQNMLSGAIEGNPELSEWLPDLKTGDLYLGYFYIFISELPYK